MTLLLQKLKEASLSVLPIVAIVIILNFTYSPLATPQLLRFLLGAAAIICGLAIFLLGVEVGIGPIGTLMGSVITRPNKLWIVAAAGVALGFLISIAEPDLHILAGQVDAVTGGLISKLSIVIVVSIGIAALLSFGLIRIVYRLPINIVLTALYALILILSLLAAPVFIPISFDASGATTGALTVPFILALALGVSTRRKDSVASEADSFGLVAITSTGAIIAVLIMSLVFNASELTGSAELQLGDSPLIFAPFAQQLPSMAVEILVALSPLLALFLIFQRVAFKLSRLHKIKILMGLLYSFIGLTLLMTGVNAGFMETGAQVGYNVAARDNQVLLVAIGFVLGLVTVLAEPAVYVLTAQIETVTSGYVKKSTVLAALSLGIGVAVALSLIRILVPSLELWHYLLPGYFISLLISYLVPKLFVGIAFDAGGVASGPMTATFILAFAQGAASSIAGADVLLDGFGIIAMVAMTPLITLQILGLIYKVKSRKGGLKRRGANS